MTPEQIKAHIAAIEAKRDAAKDDASKRYYQLCADGWRAYLARLERED